MQKKKKKKKNSTFVFVIRYETILRKARTEDLTDIASLRCLYRSGVDRHGRPIIAFVGANFTARDVDVERVGRIISVCVCCWCLDGG